MAPPISYPTIAPTQTAVLVIVPEVEPVVAQHRARMDGAASWGVPAHVTVLYPFVSPEDLDAMVLERLTAAVSAVPAFDVTFARTAWFDDDVLWLAPDPAGPFRALTAAVVSAFPGYPPYEGAYDGSTPHLTIGERRLADLHSLLHAEQEVGAALPLQARIKRVSLLAGTDAPGSWHALYEVLLS